MSSDPVEVVKTFFRVRDEKGIMAVADMLSEDYRRTIPDLDPLDKETYLAAMANVERALAQKHTLSDFVVEGKITRQQDPPPRGKKGYELLLELLEVELPGD